MVPRTRGACRAEERSRLQSNEGTDAHYNLRDDRVLIVMACWRTGTTRSTMSQQASRVFRRKILDTAPCVLFGERFRLGSGTSSDDC